MKIRFGQKCNINLCKKIGQLGQHHPPFFGYNSPFLGSISPFWGLFPQSDLCPSLHASGNRPFEKQCQGDHFFPAVPAF